ncbi:MAG: VCBS repeat-containing protein [Kiritimatiellia bacterium]|jgi:hypothetical protein
MVISLLAALALPWLASAQTNAPTASAPASNPPPVVAAGGVGLPSGKGGNLFPAACNGEKTMPLGNYWDGVDADNDLHVYVANSLVLNDAGRMMSTPMSSCPNFVDMNGDGLNDLVVSDTQGFVWIYLNSGEKGKPKFTTGAFVPTFIGWGAKINVCDWDGDGDNDVLFGTYYGDIGVLENKGSRKQWQFIRRMGIPRYVDPAFGIDDPKDRVPTLMMGKQPMILGNYMSPWVTDWNQDGKPDLIVGEGTYSANSVRLLLNTGSRNKPVFLEDRMFYLAYGEGYEQLTPAVVDYNGDGLSDLIVGTRTGQIRLYKGTKKAIEGKDMVAAIRGTLAPAVLEFSGNVNIGGPNVFDTMSFVYPCDWNEDGLFDLLLGSTKGKVYIALNQGSKTEPKFPKAEPVKGTDTEKDMLAPAGWATGIGQQGQVGRYCNAALLLSADKEVILKPGAQPIRPVDGDYFLYFRYVHNYPGWMRNGFGWVSMLGSSAAHVPGARLISMSGGSLPLKIRGQYELSFSAILEGKPVIWSLHAKETVREATDNAPYAMEARHIHDTIPPSGAWQKRTYRFKALNTVQSNLNYGLSFQMPEGEVRFMLDNLVLKEIEPR